MRASLGGTDRGKIDQYLDAVRDVERRMQLADKQSNRELPNIDQPVVTVRTTYSGADPLTMDRDITATIEGAAARVPGVVSIASQSSAGQSRVTVQFDVKTRQKKVIAFLHPFYKDRYGCTLKGTYSSAVDPKGDRVYVTWNVSRGSRASSPVPAARPARGLGQLAPRPGSSPR